MQWRKMCSYIELVSSAQHYVKGASFILGHYPDVWKESVDTFKNTSVSGASLVRVSYLRELSASVLHDGISIRDQCNYRQGFLVELC